MRLSVWKNKMTKLLSCWCSSLFRRWGTKNWLRPKVLQRSKRDSKIFWSTRLFPLQQFVTVSTGMFYSNQKTKITTLKFATFTKKPTKTWWRLSSKWIRSYSKQSSRRLSLEQDCWTCQTLLKVDLLKLIRKRRFCKRLCRKENTTWNNSNGESQFLTSPLWRFTVSYQISVLCSNQLFSQWN